MRRLEPHSRPRLSGPGSGLGFTPEDFGEDPFEEGQDSDDSHDDHLRALLEKDCQPREESELGCAYCGATDDQGREPVLGDFVTRAVLSIGLAGLEIISCQHFSE